MKIAIFTNNYLPNPYGVSMSIESFRKEFEKQGHTVYIFAPEFEGYADQNPNVFRFPALNLTFKKINFPLAIPYSCRISRILEELEIDIIHSQHPNLLGWEAKRWAKKKNVPLVFTWHTLYDQYAHFAPVFIPKKLAAWWTIKNAVDYANKAQQVIVPTPSVAKIIRKWGVKNENVAAIPSGVIEVDFFEADRAGFRKEYGISQDAIVLSLVSRLTAEKNIEFLFEAVATALEQNPEVYFVTRKGGDLSGRLIEIMTAKGLSGRVVLCGDQEIDDKKNVFAAGDIFVYASKSETQGIIIAEAMYMGLPVVAVDATGVKDVVTNQVTGLLVKENKEIFADAISRLVRDGELRKKFAENAKQIAREQYTSGVCAQKMLEVYTELLEKK